MTGSERWRSQSPISAPIDSWYSSQVGPAGVAGKSRNELTSPGGTPCASPTQVWVSTPIDRRMDVTVLVWVPMALRSV
jgi:hypothetical protein